MADYTRMSHGELLNRQANGDYSATSELDRRQHGAEQDAGFATSPGGIALRQDTDALGLGLAVLLVLAFAILAIVKVLVILPLWALALLGLAAVGAAIFITIKLGVRLVRSFKLRPVRTSICMVVFVGVAGWTVSGVRQAFSRFNTQGNVQVPIGDIPTTISRINGNGTVLFQLFSLPNRWSDPIVIPARCKQVQLSAVPKIRVTVNGSVINGLGYQPKAGDTLRFMSASNRPAATALRLFMRPPSEDELRSVIPLPVYRPRQASSSK